jgi:hypothetical protein
VSSGRKREKKRKGERMRGIALWRMRRFCKDKSERDEPAWFVPFLYVSLENALGHHGVGHF